MYRMFKKTPLDIRTNRSVIKVKDFFAFYFKGRKTKEELLAKFTELLRDDEKSTFLIHLTCFLQLDYPEIMDALESDDIYPFKPAKSTISNELYVELVFMFKLHKYFIYMIAALQEKEFIKPLISAAISKLCSELEAGHLSTDTVVLYILVLADLARGEQGEPFYFNLFNSLLTEFLQKDLDIVPRHNKVSLLFRLVGVLSMNVEDYEGDSEISELNKDFSFMLSRKIAFSSMHVFQECFNVKEMFEEPPIAFKALSIVSNILANGEYSAITEVEKNEWTLQNRFSFMNWLEFVGGCGYLALSLLKKYEAELPPECFEKLLKPAQFWTTYKPKFTFQDFSGHIKSFQEFTELFSMFGRRRRYQKAWFLAFLDYPDAFLAPAGLKLLDVILVPNADFEVALKLIKRVLELDRIKNTMNEYMSEELSSVVLKVLKNPEMKIKRNELIVEVFSKGVHNKFATKNFNVDLGSICVMMRTMNNERQASTLATFEDTVFSVVFQNPSEALEAMLTVSLRSQYFKPLLWCKTFLALPAGDYCVLAPSVKFQPSDAIGEVALFRLLDKLNELDPLLEFIGNALPLFVAEGLMSFSIAEETIRKLFRNNVDQDKPAKLGRIISIYRRLVISQLDLTLLDERQVDLIEQYVTSIVSLTCMYAQPSYFGPMLNIREKCLNLLEVIAAYKQTKLGASPEQVELSPEQAEEEMEDRSEADLGFLYIRIPEIRIHVEEYLKQNASSPESSSGAAYPKLGIDLAIHVNNSCRLEWDALIHYWRKVVYPNKPVLQKRGLCKFVAGTILLALRERGVRTANYLSFFGKFLTVLETDEDLDFKVMHEEQIGAVEVLVTFILKLYPALPAEKKGLPHGILQAKGHLLQLALLTILDLVEWMILNVKDSEVHLKARIINMLEVIPESVQWPSGAGCFPIYSTILERLKGGAKSFTPKKNYEQPSEFEILKKLAELDFEEV